MLRNLYNELSRMDLKHHTLGEAKENKIFLAATTFEPEGIDEVMLIKRVAESYHLHTIWDGQNIEIIRESR